MSIFSWPAFLLSPPKYFCKMKILFGFPQSMNEINLLSEVWKMTSPILFILELSFKYLWALYIYFRNHQYFDNKPTRCCGLFFLSRNYYFSGAITSNINGFRIQNLHSSVFLFFRFPFTDTDDPQYSRGREGTILITPYDFHPFKNVQKNICSFPYEMTALYYQPQHM